MRLRVGIPLSRKAKWPRRSQTEPHPNMPAKKKAPAPKAPPMKAPPMAPKAPAKAMPPMPKGMPPMGPPMKGRC